MRSWIPNFFISLRRNLRRFSSTSPTFFPSPAFLLSAIYNFIVFVSSTERHFHRPPIWIHRINYLYVRLSPSPLTSVRSSFHPFLVSAPPHPSPNVVRWWSWGRPIRRAPGGLYFRRDVIASAYYWYSQCGTPTCYHQGTLYEPISNNRRAVTWSSTRKTSRACYVLFIRPFVRLKQRRWSVFDQWCFERPLSRWRHRCLSYAKS